MPTAKETLEELLTNGPATDIFLAEEARAIAQVINKERAVVNRSSFARVFASLHGYAIERFILAVTRMFEVPGPKYPLQSLPAVLQCLEANAADLPIVEPYLLRNPLKRLREALHK